MTPVPICFAADGQSLASGSPGLARYYALPDHPGKHAGLNFQCPCGCGALLGVRFLNAQGQVDASCWTFDGDDQQPTCTPSIRHMDGCQWHGYLHRGTFVACE
jgi:hypothetical protein